MITGAARRIGREIALNLARDGWAVAIHFNTSGQEAAALVEEIAKAGGSATAIAGDLANAAEVAALIPAAAEKLGPLSALINNASLFLDDQLTPLDLELWQRHQDVNLRAPIQLASALAAQRPTERQANVINIIDQRVWKLNPQFFSYTLSKAALWTATKTMAQALAPHVRVNAIGPGPVLRSIYQSQEHFDAECRATVLGRGTSPAEIADGIRFILDAPAMTGQMIALDGGQHLVWQTRDVEAVKG